MNYFNKKFTKVIMSIILVGSISCGKQGNPNLLTKAEKAQINKTIQLMLSKYDAVSNWFPESEYMIDPIYTLELEQKMIRSDGRPIFFFASLIDLKKEDEQYIANLKTTNLGWELNYELEVTEEQAKLLLNQVRDPAMQYALVAKISAIKRKEFAVQILSYMDEEPVPVIESPYIFVVDGMILDILFVGKYGGLYGT